MLPLDRRDFLRHTLISGAAFASGSWLSNLGFAQARQAGPAKVIVNSQRIRAQMDRRLMGAFLEHLGRAIYGGVYEPGSELADANGFRKDVLEEIKQMNVPIMRYPGGNFVSGYNWLDGVGPKDKRPTVLERAWNSIETNQFGTNEFMAWSKLVNTEPMMAVNLGTGTPESAVALVEYCNLEKGSRWADLRRSHGYQSPYNVKYWCLGNEMDGWWQIGHMTGIEYGRKAADAGKQIRTVDRSTQLIACGSSGPFMPTYLVWDREVLEQCYHEVDGLSLHRYYNNTSETGGDTSHYLAMNLDMDRQILETLAVCDYVQGLLKSPKRLWLSFDEWNVWYRARGGDGKKEFAPKLLEEVYNLEDALLVGGLINTLLRQAERVHVACLAQIINVIAPLMTNADQVIRQTIYYPYAWALKYSKGNVLDLLVESDTYEIKQRFRAPYRGTDMTQTASIPYVDVSATLDPQSGEYCVLMLNRDLQADREVEIQWRDAAPTKLQAYETLTGSDLKAANTFDQPKRVVPQKLEMPKVGSTMTFKLPARSYTVAHLSSK